MLNGFKKAFDRSRYINSVYFPSNDVFRLASFIRVATTNKLLCHIMTAISNADIYIMQEYGNTIMSFD